MEREVAKDLTLSILVIAAIVLLADCAWLHVKCSRQSDALVALEAKVEAHVNPPPKLSMTDKAKGAYERAKEATVAGYEKVKTATTNGYEKVKAAASAGYHAAIDEYKKID